MAGRPMTERQPHDFAATAARHRRRDRRGRYQIPLLAACVCIALLATIQIPPRPRLVWNVSTSAPIGLYAVSARRQAARGDMVVAWVPRPWRHIAAMRHYLPANVPLVKRVAGVPGDTICAVGSDILVNGRPAARRRPHDGRGRPLPAWRGCFTLQGGALLLLMDAPDSFDGRYFGPTDASDVVGRARLLWAKPAEASSDG